MLFERCSLSDHAVSNELMKQNCCLIVWRSSTLSLNFQKKCTTKNGIACWLAICFAVLHAIMQYHALPTRPKRYSFDTSTDFRRVDDLGYYWMHCRRHEATGLHRWCCAVGGLWMVLASSKHVVLQKLKGKKNQEDVVFFRFISIDVCYCWGSHVLAATKYSLWLWATGHLQAFARGCSCQFRSGHQPVQPLWEKHWVDDTLMSGLFDLVSVQHVCRLGMTCFSIYMVFLWCFSIYNILQCFTRVGSTLMMESPWKACKPDGPIDCIGFTWFHFNISLCWRIAKHSRSLIHGCCLEVSCSESQLTPPIHVQLSCWEDCKLCVWWSIQDNGRCITTHGDKSWQEGCMDTVTQRKWIRNIDYTLKLNVHCATIANADLPPILSLFFIFRFVLWIPWNQKNSR